MSKRKTVVAPAVKPKEYTAKEFEKMYNELCMKTKFAIAFEPHWRKSQDTGVFSMVIIPIIVKIPEEAEQAL